MQDLVGLQILFLSPLLSKAEGILDFDYGVSFYPSFS